MNSIADQTVARAVRVFNGTYTITSPTGRHRTFRIRTQPREARFAPGRRIVALLAGPDNEGDYQPFAFIDEGGITVWRSRRGTGGEPSVWELYGRMLWAMATDEQSSYHQRGARLLLAGCCCRCNRKLTHPSSIRSGIGPECAKREHEHRPLAGRSER